MWIIKTFKTKAQMTKFINKHKNNIEWQEIFINNGYGVEFKEKKGVEENDL